MASSSIAPTWDGRYSPEALALRTDQRFGFSADFFVGPAAELVASGLITDDMLPGRPGRNKVMQSFKADGAPLGRKWGNQYISPREEGKLCIRRLSRDRFSVTIAVSNEERARREAEHRRADPRSEAVDTPTSNNVYSFKTGKLISVPHRTEEDFMSEALRDIAGLAEEARSGLIKGFLCLIDRGEEGCSAMLSGSFRDGQDLATDTARETLEWVRECSFMADRPAAT